MIATDGRIVDEIDLSESSVQAENQDTYLSCKKHEFLHFNGDSGPIHIPWQYVLNREVVDTETGKILDLDKEIATRSQEYMCRPIEGGLRNITTRFWWYRDKSSVKLGSNERQHVWKRESAHYVTAPEDCPCESKEIMRITTWDSSGRILKGAETPTLSELDGYSTTITSQEQSHRITTRILYYLPPNE